MEHGVGVAKRPGQWGADTLLDQYQVWELVIGLTTSDVGLPQQHVGFLLRHIQPALRREYERLTGPKPADPDCFLVLRPIEIKEALAKVTFNASSWTGAPGKHPLILFSPEQDILSSAAAVAARLAHRSRQERGWVVIEIASALRDIDSLWSNVPEYKRGPRRGQG
jgi:hypothetical protein